MGLREYFYYEKEAALFLLLGTVGLLAALSLVLIYGAYEAAVPLIVMLAGIWLIAFFMTSLKRPDDS